MATGVQITLIICVTIVLVTFISCKYNDNDKNNKKGNGKGEE